MLKSAYDVQNERKKSENLKLSDPIFDVGYEGRSITEFLVLLQEAEIEQIADIRERAMSRKTGFGKRQFVQNLTSVGVNYKHFPKLGSPSDIRQELRTNWDYSTFFSKYQNYLNHNQEQFDELIEFIKTGKTAILCFEKDVEKCHRKIVLEKFNENVKLVHL